MARPATSEIHKARALAIRDVLQQRMEESAMNTEDLARKSGLNRRSLDKFFEGESPSPSFFTIAALGRALDVPLNSLAELER